MMAVLGKSLTRVSHTTSLMRAVVLVSVFVACASLLTHTPCLGDTTVRVSLASDGTEPNDNCWTNAISGDGRFVVFYSEATNLVPGDTNGTWDVFVHDTVTGETERVSVASDGTQGNGGTSLADISYDGRYVAFTSESSNLVPADTNAAYDVFVRDRQTGATERISVASDGTEGNGNAWRVAISAEGRCVAFRSRAYNLVPGDTNGLADIFVHDRETGETERVSVSSEGWQANIDCDWPAISANGRYVAFASQASTLVVGDTNDAWDVFVHDRDTGQTTRVSIPDGGGEATLGGHAPAISADGRYVAFYSSSSDLVTGDTNGDSDIFVHDRLTVATERVSIASEGTQSNGDSSWPSLSADGRYVIFSSAATNLISGDTNSQADVYMHDRETGETSRVSRTASGTQIQGNNDGGFISADARYIAFVSTGATVVPDDTNGFDDTFVRNRLAANFEADTTAGQAPLLVEFTDLSTRSATMWSWHFGDGGDSYAQHPSHEYMSAGTYTVSLTVQDGVGSASETKTGYITVDPAPPVADFLATPTEGIAPLTVEFSDLSTSAPTAWSWDFGDGGTSSGQNPSHTYVAAGSYTVSLTATNAGGSDAETKEDYIAVSEPPPPAPTANFSATPTAGTAPLALDFTDLSTGDPTSWSWDFGDGGTSTGQNPSHAYEAAGIYTVTLTATNAGGSDAETKTNYISVAYPDAVPEHWACDAILACVEAGIVSGYDDGFYHPDWPVDRGQMAVYISRALASGDENVPDPTTDPGFTDVDSEHWAYKYICYAVDQNVVTGYPEGDYRPEQQVTRDQMAVYVARSMCDPTGEDGLIGYEPADPENFPDVPSDHWAYTYVEYCVEEDVVSGYPEGDYRPDNVVTRDQMAVYIARAFNLPV